MKTYHIRLHIQYSLRGDEHNMFETCRRRRVCYLVKEQHLQMLRRVRTRGSSGCLHLPATVKTKRCVSSCSNTLRSFYCSEYSNWNIAMAAWQTRKKRQDTAGLWTEAGEDLRFEKGSIVCDGYRYLTIERKFHTADTDERCERLRINRLVNTKRMHNSGKERAWE